MTTIVPCSSSSVSLIPGTAFTIKKNSYLTRCSFPKKSRKHILSSQRFVLPLPTSIGFFPKCRTDCARHHKSIVHTVSATGTEVDVVVDESESTVAEEVSSDIPADAAETSESSSTASNTDRAVPQSKRSRPSRKSEMPPVKNEELIPGATFTGKVRSIQPFGAFVDFGAFTDGLVHVSRLSDSFVKDVGDVVSLGQEVKVRLVEANTETGRISLTMRENDTTSKDAPATAGGDKPRPGRRNTQKPGQRRQDIKTSKFVRGQELQGTIKNLTRSGCFISLPEGEEGFLPHSEEADDGLGSMMGASSLEIGQEVSVRVLRFARGQVTLTMKKEGDNNNLDEELSQGVIHAATNPFMLAFRKNKEISAFLDEREKVVKESLEAETSVKVEGQVNPVETVSDIPEVQDQPASSDEVSASVSSTVVEAVEEEMSSEEVAGGSSIPGEDEKSESTESYSSQIEGAVQTVQEEAAKSSEISDPEKGASDKIIEEAPSADEIESDGKSDSSAEISNQVSSPVSPIDEGVESKLGDATPGDKETITPEENGSITGSDGEESIDNSDPSESTGVAESTSLDTGVVENQVESAVNELQIEASVAEAEIPSALQVENEKVEPVPEKSATSSESSGQSNDASPKATISPAVVKQLREETGAGMMNCKKALSESGGDIVKAQEFLRKKGLASAEKKASRATAEGRISSYIHDSRIGVLVEVNCETDFVSRGDIFKELVDDLAMQVAACPQVQYLATEDVPEEMVIKEKEIEMQKEDLLSKPEQIRSKIVDGRIAKRLAELALLEQPYIKNDKIVIKDWVKQTIATIGENIKVKRFVRYNLGEGLEKKSQDFAAEVAAQTAAKPAAAPAKEESASAEAKETSPKPAAATISAALVKQLRDETGAGMMDCKKALSETGGDLEKAQEYLRKKGLSAADKKSSRLAAEGRIGSYIHDSRIGVLIEVNCETDFVGRSENFKELVDDLAMQVVASPLVQFVSVEDIPESIVKQEKELEMQREDLLSKPEHIREKIVDGRISKRLGELALLEQPFIKNDSILVKDLVKQTVAALGENIKVRRFVRFTLGESIEDAKSETEA
ncbi:polyprotein of EF-Ts, chloroplastic isoform X2 [Euphorbia lathyris]|uniref:polyprotein of EF-Ts, chloroplastic isoform X2 n=1 Tax=Euphorbia lathyris TaxID=212925 RepID=UPI0033135915